MNKNYIPEKNNGLDSSISDDHAGCSKKPPCALPLCCQDCWAEIEEQCYAKIKSALCSQAALTCEHNTEKKRT